MPSDPVPVHDPDSGEVVGQMVVNDSGVEVYFNADTGVVWGAIDADGDELEVPDGLVVDLLSPDGYAVAEQPDPNADHAAVLDARLAALEARANQPVVMVAGDETEYNPERLTEAMERQGQLLEAELGRPLTLAERRNLANEAIDAVRLGEPMDLTAASERLAWEGRPGVQYDLDDDVSRQQYMTQRLRDAERMDGHEERGDNLLSEHPPPERTEFNLDDDGDRQQYMVQRALGQDAHVAQPEEP
jgi:hypothetical protein